MHSKQFWILALLLIQVIFLATPAFTFPPVPKSDAGNNGAMVRATSNGQTTHSSNTKAMANSNQETAMQETTPVSSSPSFDYKPKEDEDDASNEEIEKYLAAKESYAQAVDPKKQFYTDYQGLEDHAYYLSYKMPRKVWNSINTRGKMLADYLKVLDPKRVSAYYGNILPDSKDFKENHELLDALHIVNHVGEATISLGDSKDRFIPRPDDVAAHALPVVEDRIDIR